MKNQVFFLVALIISAIIIACASQRLPTGGAVDKVPPEIIGVYPAPNATNVERDIRVAIEFNERIEKRSLEGAVFISPRQKDAIKSRVRGKKLTIEFPDTLRKNRTYVLTIGTNTADLRRNRMTESFHLAFSTGDKLDQGRISGNVYYESKVEGTIVGAYSFGENSEPDPSSQYAEYVTQCNASGAYQFSYIAPGKYRLFAIHDKDGNQKYDHGFDEIGIPTTDVVISEEFLNVSDIHFQLALKDTVFPGLKTVSSIDRHHVDVRFDESIKELNTTDWRSYFAIVVENSTSDTLQILDMYQNSMDNARFHLKTTDQDSALSYQLTVKDMFDIQGNPIDTSLNSYNFKGLSFPDTLKPKLIQQSVVHKQKDVTLRPEIQLIFSEAIAGPSLEKHFSLADSNKSLVDGDFTWDNPADVSFIPHHDLMSTMKYNVHIEVDSVFDEYGNALADTAIDFEFTTLNKDTLSSLSGKVIDKLAGAQGRFYLTAQKIGSDKITYKTELDSTDYFKFESIFPGIYLLYGFRDADSNGVYSYGEIVPFKPAERFIFYPDSVKIRSRWPNEGNDIIFKEY